MNLKDFITKQTSNRHFDEFVSLLPDSYKGNFIKFLDDYEVALKEEYAANDTPKYCTIKGVDFLIPASYNGDVDSFLDDISYFQNNENHKYEIHNACNKNNQIEQKDIVLNVTAGDNDSYSLHLLTPLKMAKRQASKEDIELELMKKMVARYMTAYTKTCRLNEDRASEQKEIQDKIDSSKEGKTDDKVLGLFNKSEHKLYTSIKSKTSDKKRPISLSQSYFSYCNNEHSKHIAKITAMRLGSALKWSAKQTADVAIGLLGSPFFAAYNLLDKKYHIAEKQLPRILGSIRNFTHTVLNDYVRPKIKKALLTASITTILSTSALAAIKYSDKIGNFFEKVKTEQNEKKQAKIDIEKQAYQEKIDKEAFFKKYDTTDEVFYQNYKTVKEHEAMIVALLSCPEGFCETAYICQAGKPTIGYGTRVTIKNGKPEPVVLGMKITKEEAYNDAVYHLNKYVYPKLKHLNKKLEPQQLAAVCMFIYNAGENSFEGSKLCNAINNNESDEKIREAFSIVRKAGGGRSYGLIDRNGFSGSVYCCKDIRKCIVIKPTIAGSPDIRYYEYDSPNSRDPIQNDDLTFEVRNFNNVIDDIKKFQTESIEKTIVYTLPPNITKDILKQYGIHVGDKGRITTDISWDDAKNITSKSNKKWFNKNTSKQTRWYKHRSR